MYSSGDFDALAASVDAANDAGDHDAARDAIARAWPSVSTTHGHALRALIHRVPRAEDDPWLVAALGASYRSLGSGSRSAALPYFRTAESLLAADPTASAAAIAGVGLHYAAALRSLGRLDTARRTATAAAATVEGDLAMRPGLRVRIQAKLALQLGIIELHLGEYESAMTRLRLAYGLSEQHLLVSEYVECCSALAFLLYASGNFEKAQEFTARAHIAAGDTGLALSRFGAAAVITELLVAVEQSRLEEVIALIPQVRAAVRRSDWEPLGHYAIGSASVVTGRHIEGLEQLRIAIHAVRQWEGDPVVRTIGEGMRGVLYMHLGEHDRALAIISALPATENHANCPTRFVAAIRFAAGDIDGARMALAECEALGEHHSSRTLIDVLLLAAAIDYERGNTVAAEISFDRALLQASRTGMRQSFLVIPPETMQRMLALALDRKQPPAVHELLDTLSAHRSAPSRAAIEPLSDRERDVAHHLYLDKTIGQIAADLFISSNTVKTHVRSIYRKLEASNRREAVRRVRELGLHLEITRF